MGKKPISPAQAAFAKKLGVNLNFHCNRDPNTMDVDAGQISQEQNCLKFTPLTNEQKESL